MDEELLLMYLQTEYYLETIDRMTPPLDIMFYLGHDRAHRSTGNIIVFSRDGFLARS